MASSSFEDGNVSSVSFFGSTLVLNVLKCKCAHTSEVKGKKNCSIFLRCFALEKWKQTIRMVFKWFFFFVRCVFALIQCYISNPCPILSHMKTMTWERRNETERNANKNEWQHKNGDDDEKQKNESTTKRKTLAQRNIITMKWNWNTEIIITLALCALKQCAHDGVTEISATKKKKHTFN